VKVKKENGQKAARSIRRRHSESEHDQEVECKKIKKEVVAFQPINMVKT